MIRIWTWNKYYPNTRVQLCGPHLITTEYWDGILFMNRWLISKNIFNTLRPRQNGRHFPDDIFKWIFFNENVWILINISLKFVPGGPINNIPTLVQVMAWCRPGASHYLNQWWLNYQCIYASLGLNELKLQYYVIVCQFLSYCMVSSSMQYLSFNKWSCLMCKFYIFMCYSNLLFADSFHNKTC